MPSSIGISPASAKGDILSFNGSSRSRIAVGTTGQILTARSSAASGVQFESSSIAPAKFDLISSSTLTANSATVTFSSIPTTYKWLKIIATTSTASTGGSQPIIVLNANSTKTYYWQALYRSGASVLGTFSNRTDGIYVSEVGNTGSGQQFTVDIACNNTTNHETQFYYRSTDSDRTNTNIRFTIGTANVLLGASITSILLKNISTDVFGSGSSFHLYGRTA